MKHVDYSHPASAVSIRGAIFTFTLVMSIVVDFAVCIGCAIMFALASADTPAIVHTSITRMMFQEILFPGDEEQVYENVAKVLEKNVDFKALKQTEQAQLLYTTCMRSGPFVGARFNKRT